MVSLFGKKCAYCGKRLEDGQYITRVDKQFCTEEHAKAYEDYVKQSKESKNHSGCGC